MAEQDGSFALGDGLGRDPSGDLVAHAGRFVMLCAEILGPLSDNFGTAISLAGLNAVPDTNAGELVLDIEALLRGMIAMPSRSKRLRHAGQWLGDWLGGRRFAGPRFQADAGTGLTPVISDTLRNSVFRRAVDVRDATMNEPSQVGLRHVLFALAELSPGRWPKELQPLAPADLKALRESIVDETSRTPLKGEDMAAWDALLKGNTPPPQQDEHTPILEDNPATIDLLGRKPVAEALAMRLRRLYPDLVRDRQALLVHLDGPWGSGKSSIVNFLRAELEQGRDGWLVVDFNAWRNARVKPPWWSLLTELRRQIAARQGYPGRLLLDLEWFWWRATRESLLLVASVVLMAAGLWFVTSRGIDLAGTFKSWEDTIKLFGGVASGVGGLLVFSRSTFFGSVSSADAFDALRTDAFAPVIRLFERLVNTHSARPILIVLDDLDRCDAGTVTELLEGVQTLFRSAPVVFLAVADRRWITASFGDRFKLFESVIGDPARPLGDLFLDKMFQLSVAVPAVTTGVRAAYLAHLLGRAPMAALPESVPAWQAGDTHETMQARIKAAPEADKPALRAAAVRALATPAADRAAQHRLMAFADMIEPNPRAMKRLVNAVGLNQAQAIIEGREADFDLIARWTLFALRWPRAAGAVSGNPALIASADHAAITSARTDPLFAQLVGADGGLMNEAALRRLLG
ncbi:P-loop NTPase fold protein [Sandarakinorhabdus sp.]|uniref:KAP family P-loop NTPase fold protein n=1 Tax=Sandarakinorhabdus sp. TaxID=1916663 RepID=UPI00286E746B|nr:P-loop NTPase fold protein [Sandarakinorhabdus sp.]